MRALGFVSLLLVGSGCTAIPINIPQDDAGISLPDGIQIGTGDAGAKDGTAMSDLKGPPPYGGDGSVADGFAADAPLGDGFPDTIFEGLPNDGEPGDGEPGDGEPGDAEPTDGQVFDGITDGGVVEDGLVME